MSVPAAFEMGPQAQGTLSISATDGFTQLAPSQQALPQLVPGSHPGSRGCVRAHGAGTPCLLTVPVSCPHSLPSEPFTGSAQQA